MNADTGHGGTWARLRGRRPESRPWWAWAGLAGITVLAIALFTWALSRNGMGNPYYAAAVKSGTISWKAWFFGAFDPSSFITVDKLPASLWVQGLFTRVFGFSSWTLLLPQALAGVASVLILHHLVRRWQGEVAALLAALAFAVTPVAVVMFRLNGPDAMLTLLFLGAAWALWSALEKGSTWKLVLCGVLIGFAFLTKMLEALIVLPAFVSTYLVCGPGRWGRRLLQLLAAAGALVVAGGWWVAVVELWPEATRPYIGGSTDNSVLDLVFGRSGGYLGTSGPVLNFSGSPGWLRMFNNQFGGQIAWLIPLALIGLVAGLWWTRRGPRTDRARAGYLMWGVWTLVCFIVISLAKGLIHPYYAVVLAPSVAALAGGGAVVLWRLGSRHRALAWLVPAAVVGTAVLARELLGRTPDYAPWLSTAILVMAVVGAAGLFVAMVRPLGDRLSDRLGGPLGGRALVIVACAVAMAGVLAGPTAYSLGTVVRSVDGIFGTAGPEAATRFAFVAPGGPVRTPVTGGTSGRESPAAPGNLGADSPAHKRLAEFLLANRGEAKYLVATQGALAAAPFILATGEPVMAMGGFDGSNPAPTMAEFQHMVDTRQVRYVILGGLGAFTGGFGNGSSISQWVKGNGKKVESQEYGGSLFGGMLYQLW